MAPDFTVQLMEDMISAESEGSGLAVIYGKGTLLG